MGLGEYLGRQLGEGGLQDILARHIGTAGLAPESFRFELTESMVIDQVAAVDLDLPGQSPLVSGSVSMTSAPVIRP